MSCNSFGYFIFTWYWSRLAFEDWSHRSKQWIKDLDYVSECPWSNLNNKQQDIEVETCLQVSSFSLKSNLLNPRLRFISLYRCPLWWFSCYWWFLSLKAWSTTSLRFLLPSSHILMYTFRNEPLLKGWIWPQKCTGTTFVVPDHLVCAYFYPFAFSFVLADNPFENCPSSIELGLLSKLVLENDYGDIFFFLLLLLHFLLFLNLVISTILKWNHLSTRVV